MPVQIAPSILSGDFANMGQTVKALESAGADMIHIDVMDGRFVPNLTFGPPLIAAIREYTALPFDVHLMIAEPERSVADYIKAGADRVTVHAEACLHLQRTLSLIHDAGVRAGVAFNPATAVDALPYVLDDVDLVLVMTVNPGFGGQSFLVPMLHKLRAVRQMFTDRSLEQTHLQVDGGINDRTAKLCVAAGADVLVAGSHVFSAPTLAQGIASLR